MIAVDADSGICLGLTGGKVWTRKRKVKIAHEKRALADKELARWVTTAEQGRDALAAARMITVVNDREGDFFAHWALTPADNVHLLTRAMHDHALADGGTLYQAVERARFCDKAAIDLPKRMDRRGRRAHLSMRFGTVVLKRPQRPGVKDLPEGVKVSFVEVVELHPRRAPSPFIGCSRPPSGRHRRRCLADRLLVQAALDHRTALSLAEEPGAAHRGQSARQR